jgi:hypothetical protein
LGEIDTVIQVYAVEPVILFFDFAENFQPGGVGQSFGNLFRRLRVHLRHIASIYMQFKIKLPFPGSQFALVIKAALINLRA